MLSQNLFGDKLDEAIVADILLDFHKNGPVSSNHLETLSYLKKNFRQRFATYESRLMFIMGLFYKATIPKSFVEAIYKSYSDSILEQTNHLFTPVQADAYNSIKRFTNFSFSAPTSAGKSFLFQEILKESKGDIIIVVPSRALLSEYLIKVKKLVNKETLVLPFIEIVNVKKTKNRIYVITPERGEDLFKYFNRLNVDLILLDEAQISEEGIRGMKFDSLVRRIDKKLANIKKVFTHPFVANPEAQFVRNNIQQNVGAQAYNQKTVGKIFIEHENGAMKYFSPYEDWLRGKAVDGNLVKQILRDGGTALIYISKAKIYDGTFIELFAEYIELCPEITDKVGLKFIDKLEEFFGTKDDKEKNSILIYLIKRGIVIHHGSIPLKARLLIEQFVNSKQARICFSTSTLIQGINMPFDIVWINFFNFKGTEDQKALHLKNLIGRAGRTTTESNSFDFGYVIVEKKNVRSFIRRLLKEPVLSLISNLDNPNDTHNEDFSDVVDGIKNDTFNSELQLTDVQIDRIAQSDIDPDIKTILDLFLNKKLNPLTAQEYFKLSVQSRDSIKLAFQNVYRAHLKRKVLTDGERQILETAIPILLWLLQGKSFAEVVSLRYAYLSEKDFRRDLRRRMLNGTISQKEYQLLLNNKKVKYSCIAETLPNKAFKRGVALFPPNTSIININFDQVIYDTYDYIDKVISLSLSTPISSTLQLYFGRTGDVRALALSNYIKYGTNDEIEIWLTKYGFSFDEIEELKQHIESIDEDQIIFKPSIQDFIKDPDKLELVERYL